MDFTHFLSSHMMDKSYGGKRTYQDMVEQAVMADRVGYTAVVLPEHHLINILMLPSPLQMAVKVSCLTKKINLITSVAVLPIRDMRIFAGEVVQADMLCDGRLMLGVGRGAFAYEVGRLGTPIEITQRKFDESLAVLEALLTEEEVSWDGEFYKFEPLTIMPRPMRPIPLMLAVMAPDKIYDGAKKGYNIQTTPLRATHEYLLEQVNAFHRGKADAGEKGRGKRISLQRGMYLARDEADAKEKIAFAHEYYKRFDNVFTGPGVVHHGVIEPLPREQSAEELGRNLVICPRSEMLDRLGAYAEAGIDEMIVTSNFGQPQEETLDMMQRLAEEIIPHFAARRSNAA
ncbi:MAG: hypothetical protein QOK29_970 [Rhodospirillaceae bacterium]|nr:hypothetical protein [Rhodospirillaceae bacterium]